jgi:hypothetical protein
MAAGLSSGFEHLLVPAEEKISLALREGLVVVDTNVLLDAYRFAPEARSDLLKALEALSDRLWIPHQVALEFHRNRADVIADHDAAYRDASTAISNFRQQCSSDLSDKIRRLAGRIALEDSARDRLTEMVSGGLDSALTELESLRAQHGITSDSIRDDPVLTKLQVLLHGKVGSAPSVEDEKSSRLEADRRIAENIPPGYQDHKKLDPHGDYLFWQQSLVEARSRQKVLVIVTRDVKEDWFWRVGGKTIGARPELVKECHDVASVDFILMTTRGFLHRANANLSTSVSDATLRQAEVLPPPHDRFPDPRLRPPRQMAVTPSLISHVARESEHDVRQLEDRLAQLAARRDELMVALRASELADEALEEILTERDHTKIRIERHSRDLTRLRDLHEWAATEALSARAGGRLEIPNRLRVDLRHYAETFTPDSLTHLQDNSIDTA